MLFQPDPHNIEIVASLSRVSTTETRLSLVASGLFDEPSPTIGWTFYITGLTGQPCSSLTASSSVPAMRTLRQSQTGTDSYEIQGESSRTAEAIAFVDVRVCWSHSSPIATSGAYLSAALPEIFAGEDQGSLTRVLSLPGNSLFQYSLQSGTPPSAINSHSWLWSSSLSQNIDSPSSSEIPVAAASIVGLQWDNNKAFVSGILLGVAGGAVVTLITGLLGAVDEARKRRLRRPGEGAGIGGELSDKVGGP